MKEYHYYCCERCGKKYDTQEEAANCEKSHDEKTEARKRIENMISEYYDKYGELPFFNLPHKVFRVL